MVSAEALLLLGLFACEPADRPPSTSSTAETQSEATPTPLPPSEPTGLTARISVDPEHSVPVACLHRETLVGLLQHPSTIAETMDEMDRQGIKDCIWIGGDAQVLVVGESTEQLTATTVTIVELRLPNTRTSIYTLRRNIQ
jgi:hypothetical protein